MTDRLPPADPLLVARTTAALPARLQAKVDAAVAAAASWVITGSVVHLPGGAEVVLSPSADGVLRLPEQVVCACLLAPGCLHRAGVLAAAPVALDSELGSRLGSGSGSSGGSVGGSGGGSSGGSGGGSRGGSGDGSGGDSSSDVPESVAEESIWSASEQEVAEVLRAAAARVLEAGVAGVGVAEQAELLIGVHRARAAGLHRLAAAATRVVTAVRAARRDEATFSLPALTLDLLDLLEVTQVIGGAPGTDVIAWRGRARNRYLPVGGLRLTGLCLEPVLTDSGYAGVVVWLIDADHRLWSVSDVKPGDEERISLAAQGPVALGETGLSHRQLSRAGMMLSGATADPDGRLGAGAKVRAVSAAGSDWTATPLRERFGGLGVAGAGAASAPPGTDRSLRLLDLTICGGQGDVVLAVDEAGVGVRLGSGAAPGSAWAITVRDNLRLLADAPGLRLLAVGRIPDPSSTGARPGSIDLLAVGGGDLRLPTSFGGHVDVGIDRLSSAFLVPSGPGPMFPEVAAEPDPLIGLRRRLRRVVSGGRRTLTVPGVPVAVRAEADHLRRDQLGTGAALLEALVDAGAAGERDGFGRLIVDDPAALARAWLAAGLYVREVGRALTQQMG